MATKYIYSGAVLQYIIEVQVLFIFSATLYYSNNKGDIVLLTFKFIKHSTFLNIKSLLACAVPEP